MNLQQQLTEVLSCLAPNIRTCCRSGKAWTFRSSCPRYVRQRPDDRRRSGVKCSLTDQRRVTCISAAFSEPFWSSPSLSSFYGGLESPGTDIPSYNGLSLHQPTPRHGPATARMISRRSRPALRACGGARTVAAVALVFALCSARTVVVQLLGMTSSSSSIVGRLAQFSARRWIGQDD